MTAQALMMPSAERFRAISNAAAGTTAFSTTPTTVTAAVTAMPM
jgi:hypothetical protein